MVTTAFRVIVALGVSLTAVQGADQAGNDGAIAAGFRQAVEKDFVAYVEALNRYLRSRPPERRGSHPEPPNEVDQVFQRFEDAVIKNWPFAVPGAFPAQGGKSPHVALEAAEAFKAAARFESEEYFQGKVPRDRAVAEWLRVADRFPGTPQYDEALIRAALLHMKRLVGGAKRDPAAALNLLKRLASRPGPPSASTLMAQDGLTESIEDPARTWEARSKLKEDLRRKRRDIEWLKANLLVPTDRTTPRQFAQGIVAVLYQLEGIPQGTTARGMEFDKSVGVSKPPPITVPPERKEEPVGEGLSPGAIAARFRQAVEKDFVAYVEALNRYLRSRPPERRGSHPEPPNEVDQVFQRFEDAVIKNWPYGVRGRFSAPGGKSSHVALEAAEAFKAAARFESEQYLEGKAPRDRAVAEWVSVADRFPGTPQYDEALTRAAVLYMQRLVGGAKRDPTAALNLLKRLASRPGPPSAFTLLAEEDVAAFIEDPAKRWEVRGKLMEDVRRKQQDIEWLKANLLVPTDRTTPRQFAHGIVGVLYQLEGIQGTTGHGMEFDKSVGATKPPPITVPEPQPEPIPDGLSPGGIVLLAISGVLLIAFLAGPWLRRRLRRPPEGKA